MLFVKRDEMLQCDLHRLGFVVEVVKGSELNGT
jgi:hypothetical protein